jgi:hypothetical protein
MLNPSQTGASLRRGDGTAGGNAVASKRDIELGRFGFARHLLPEADVKGAVRLTLINAPTAPMRAGTN